MTKAYRSNRIYKHTLPVEVVSALTETLRLFNRGKHFACQAMLRQSRQHKSDPSVSYYLQAQSRFGLSSYYARDAVKVAKETFKNQKELEKSNEDTIKAQIKKVEKKIANTVKGYNRLLKIKSAFIAGKVTECAVKPRALALGI
jgi:hypothetical protein